MDKVFVKKPGQAAVAVDVQRARINLRLAELAGRRDKAAREEERRLLAELKSLLALGRRRTVLTVERTG